MNALKKSQVYIRAGEIMIAAFPPAISPIRQKRSADKNRYSVANRGDPVYDPA